MSSWDLSRSEEAGVDDHDGGGPFLFDIEGDGERDDLPIAVITFVY